MLKEEGGDIVVLRPAIVGPSVALPYKGYGGERASTLVSGALLFLSSRTSFWYLPDNEVPVIPCDVVGREVLRRTFGEDGGTFNAIWDSEDTGGEGGFTWKKFSETTILIGQVKGVYGRWVGMVSKFLGTDLGSRGDGSGFSWWHKTVTMRLLETHCKFLECIGRPKEAAKIRKAKPFLNLPILFKPFTERAFYFKSSISKPSKFDDEEYMVLCGLAGEKFREKIGGNKKGTDLKNLVIAGRRAREGWSSDLLWACGQPRGNGWIRLVGFVLVKILRMTVEEVTVDVASFQALAREIKGKKEGTTIVLAPTHRSMYDFLLLSYLAFTVPELSLEIPSIAAANDFETIPILSTVAKGSGAIFIKRGGGGGKGLASSLKSLRGAVEVFIEGTRSRDRRHLKPKTGFLRALVERGGDIVIVPICITYERTAEQAAFVKGGGGVKEGGLGAWASKVLGGKVQLGRIHMEAGTEVVRLSKKSNLKHVVKIVQQQQMAAVRVSDYHIRAGSTVLGVEAGVLRSALGKLGVKTWGRRGGGQAIEPVCDDERWTVALQFSHTFAPLVEERGLEDWAEWMCSSRGVWVRGEEESDVKEVVDAFVRVFEGAEEGAKLAMATLRNKGFEGRVSEVHVEGYYEGVGGGIKKFAIAKVVKEEGGIVEVVEEEGVVEEEEEEWEEGGEEGGEDEEAFGAWGFKDSKFVMAEGKTVVMKGDRYSIGGRKLKVR